ncbi:MAG: SIMPL domain-containing protein [Muribaculaceae bacterium]|nr:SIMPL domain-containing protein [Muribaculaceae bacterium]MDE6611360.1 SIMPL domain-containing protein [Muribaculaceae bacterium]
MKPQTLIISSALIAAAIVILGFALKGGIDRFADRDRVVTVRGLCEKEVNANKVTWPIVTKEMGNDLGSIYTKIQSTNQSIVSFLKSNGITDAEISVNPPSVYDNIADRYSSQNVTYRYQVTNVVVVTSEKVEQVRELIKKQTELLRQGIAVVAGDYNYQTRYEYTDLNSIKPSMIAEATANARQAADKFASDSDSKLGKIKTASQGQFSIDDRDQYTPNIKTVRIVTYITYYLED